MYTVTPRELEEESGGGRKGVVEGVNTRIYATSIIWSNYFKSIHHSDINKRWYLGKKIA